jgi:hypothetical protein
MKCKAITRLDELNSSTVEEEAELPRQESSFATFNQTIAIGE